jgi:hypothetical protein
MKRIRNDHVRIASKRVDSPLLQKFSYAFIEVTIEIVKDEDIQQVLDVNHQYVEENQNNR